MAGVRGKESAGWLSKFLQEPEPEQAEAGSQEFHPDLPCRWQGPKYLTPHCGFFGISISRKPETGAELGLQPAHSNMRHGRPRLCLNRPAPPPMAYLNRTKYANDEWLLAAPLPPLPVCARAALCLVTLVDSPNSPESCCDS